MKFLKQFSILLVLFLLFQSVYACKIVNKEYIDIYNNSSNIFIGEFIELNNEKFKFKNIKTYKGDKLKNFNLIKGNTSCDYSDNDFKKGELWLIFASLKEGKLYFNFTSQSKKFKSVGQVATFFANEIISKKGIDNSSKNQANILGPTNRPNIKGPTIRPPTRAEVEKMIKRQDPNLETREGQEEISFWKKIVRWVKSIFN